MISKLVLFVLIIMIKLSVNIIPTFEHYNILSYFDAMIRELFIKHNESSEGLYNIFERIGWGSFGIVFKIKNEYQNNFTKDLALKITYNADEVKYIYIISCDNMMCNHNIYRIFRK